MQILGEAQPPPFKSHLSVFMDKNELLQMSVMQIS